MLAIIKRITRHEVDPFYRIDWFSHMIKVYLTTGALSGLFWSLDNWFGNRQKYFSLIEMRVIPDEDQILQRSLYLVSELNGHIIMILAHTSYEQIEHCHHIFSGKLFDVR